MRCAGTREAVLEEFEKFEKFEEFEKIVKLEEFVRFEEFEKIVKLEELEECEVELSPRPECGIGLWPVGSIGVSPVIRHPCL